MPFKTDSQIPLFELGEGEYHDPVTDLPAPPPKTAPPKVKPERPAHRSRKKIAKKSKKRSGLVPEGDVRLTANIRQDLHLRLKIEAARNRTTVGEIIEELVEKHITE